MTLGIDQLAANITVDLSSLSETLISIPTASLFPATGNPTDASLTAIGGVTNPSTGGVSELSLQPTTDWSGFRGHERPARNRREPRQHDRSLRCRGRGHEGDRFRPHADFPYVCDNQQSFQRDSTGNSCTGDTASRSTREPTSSRPACTRSATTFGPFRLSRTPRRACRTSNGSRSATRTTRSWRTA